MTEREFTKILVDLSGDIGEIKAQIKGIRTLHEQCPARLGFDKLKEQTARFKKESSDSIMPPAMRKSIAPMLWKIAPWLLLAMISGAAAAGYMIARPVNVPAIPLSAQTDTP